MPERLDGTFAALADPTRRAVVGLLRERPLRSGELAASLATSHPSMSRHLRVLRRSGLVTVSEEGSADDARARVYRLRAEALTEARDWLDEVAAFWGDQLAAFKAHAERAGRKGRRGRRRP